MSWILACRPHPASNSANTRERWKVGKPWSWDRKVLARGLQLTLGSAGH
jgi:hypothetical protein